MEKIRIYRRKLEKINEIELKQDLIVPDVKQDIFQILEGNFYSYISKIDVSNERIRVSGNVETYISYLSVGEEKAVLQTVLSFEDILENSIIDETMNLQYEIAVSKQEIKIVNERKISIILTLSISYYVFGLEETNIIEDFSDIEDVQLNFIKTNISSFIGQNSNVASVKENIKVESTDIVSDIIKVETNILNKEVKISYNKVLTKADLEVNIEYLTQDGRIAECIEKFPLMSFVDIENVKEENICSTDYQLRNLLININSVEENSLTIQMDYEVICNAFENREYKLVSDLYSLKYDIEYTSKEIEISDIMSKNGEEKVQTISVVQDVIKREIENKDDYGIIVYNIRKNDNLWNVSKKFRVKQENVIKINNLEEPYKLKSGSKIYIVK